MKQGFILPRRDGIIGEWNLDGSAIDTSGSGNNGTPLNVVYTGTDRGYQSQCGVFNGSNSSITATSYAFNNTQYVSTSFWFKATNVTGFKMLTINRVSAATKYFYTALNGANINFLMFNVSGANASAVSTTNLVAGVWYHIVCTFDASTLKVYINGVLDCAASLSGNIGLDSGATLRIGMNDSSQYFGGNIQVVRQLNRLVEQQEVYNLYLEGLRMLGGSTMTPIMDGIVAYYDMRGDANDVVGGLNGTISGNVALTTDNFGNANSAYLFDGNTDYITTLFTTAIGTSDWSFETMVYFNTLGTDDNIFIKIATSYLNFAIDGTDTTKLQLQTSDGPNTSTLTTSTGYVTTGQWYHLIATIGSSGTVLSIYKDGGNKATATVTARNVSNTAALTLSRNNATACLDGKMAFFIIYNRTLSDTEVKALYDLSSRQYLLPFA